MSLLEYTFYPYFNKRVSLVLVYLLDLKFGSKEDKVYGL